MFLFICFFVPTKEPKTSELESRTKIAPFASRVITRACQAGELPRFAQSVPIRSIRLWRKPGFP